MADASRLVALGMVPELAKEVANQINNISAPVASVNGQTGTVVLDANDVGAVESVNGQTGVVVLDATDVGAVEVPDTPPAYSTTASDIADALVAAGLMAPNA